MHARLVLLGDLALVVVLFVLTLVLGRPDGALILAALPALAAGLARARPVWALALVWAAGALQVAAASFIATSWLALPFVAYRVARHGSRPTVCAGALSIPAAAVAAVVAAVVRPDTVRNVVPVADLVRLSGRGVVGALLVLLAVNSAPFALGLVARVSERSRRAEARVAAEHEIAQARAGQTALARDVHDVVGHSLAVIIAQADAAQLATADEPTRTALARISAVGRSSLAEVRDVLAQTDDTGTGVDAPTPDLDELIAGVRTAGNAVTDHVDGAAVAMDDATSATAYRVLQEMLTNSLKHGAKDGAIEINRVWTPDGLTLRVANPIATSGEPAGEGMGLTGLRTRLDAVGGTFRAGTTAAPPRFVATAFVPVGPR